MSNVKSQSINPSNSAGYARYQFAGFFAALLLALVAFGLLWILNGYLTIQFFARFGVAIWLGLLLHLIISVIEQHLWRARRVLKWIGLDELWPVLRFVVYPAILIVGVVDTGTNATELVLLADRWGWPALTLASNTAWTLLAEFIAVAAEPLFVMTLIVTIRVVRVTRKRG